MAIEFACGACGKRFTVKDELAGKRGKCSACGEPFEVPAASRVEAYPLEPELETPQPSSNSPEPDAPPAVQVALDEVPPGPGAVDLGIATDPSPWAAPSAPIGLGPDPGFPQRVVVVNFDMKFTTLVRFMVKVAIASIPATIILWLLLLTLMMLFYGIISLILPSATRPAPPLLPRQVIIDRQPAPNPFMPDNAPYADFAEPVSPAERKR